MSDADNSSKRRPLNARQQAFVREYLVDRVAVSAARRAGYGSPEVAGPRMLRNALIHAAVVQAESQQAKRLEVKADDVISEIKRLAFSNIPDALLSNGGRGMSTADLKALPPEVSRAISSVEMDVDAEGTPFVAKIKFWDKGRALDQLARHLSLYHDKVELSVDDGLGALLQAALAPAKPPGDGGQP
jgi:phage terminase small subunit